MTPGRREALVVLALLIVSCGASTEPAPPASQRPSVAEPSPSTPSATPTTPAEEPASARPEPTVSSVPAPSPARPIAAPNEALPVIGVGPTYTCALFADRLVCIGAVPTMDPRAPRLVRRELQADLFVAGSDAYCVAKRGEREVRCFGDVPSEALYDRWTTRCGEDEVCMAAREAEYDREGLRLRTPHPITDLAGIDDRLCAVAGDDLVCWSIAADDPHRPLRAVRIAGARDVDAATGLVCVRTEAGAVSCREDFGDDSVGAMRAIRGLPPVVRIAVAGAFACGWEANGQAHCWGDDLLIDETELRGNEARRVLSFDGVVALSTSSSHEIVCVIDAARRTRCWGFTSLGNFGRRTRSAMPAAIEIPITGGQQLAVGPDHACAIDGDRFLRCWGRADAGALGPSRARTEFAPNIVAGVSADALSLHQHRTCARTASGWVCWGLATAETAEQPWRVRNLGDREATPIAHSIYDCRVRANTMRCRHAAQEHNVPVQFVVPGVDCIVRPGGTLACGRLQQLRDVAGVDGVTLAVGNVTSVATYSRSGDITIFRRSLDGVTRTRSVAAGPDVTHLGETSSQICVRRRDASVWCMPSYGGSTLTRRELPPIEELVSGGAHICVRARDASVHCWGTLAGAAGVAGRPTEPTRVPGVENAVEIAAGDSHTCARLRDGRVSCWGADSEGQLGARPPWWTDAPVAVDMRE